MARSRLRKSSGDGDAAVGRRVSCNSTAARRAFGKISAATATLSSVAMSGTMIRKAHAKENAGPAAGATLARTICAHCSVGCGMVAEVRNGVWVNQRIAADHPMSRGALCRKGAEAMAVVGSPRRLKEPMKKVNGRWTVIGWDQAITEIGDQLLALRKQYGPDALYFNASARVSTEMAYLQRKFAAFWGSNNIGSQACVQYPATAASVAAAWGYRAMTHSLSDMRAAGSLLVIGRNPSEAHPVAMQHILHAMEKNRAPLIVVDSGHCRLSAKATEHVRTRSGTDAAFLLGLLRLITGNGWADREFLRTREAGYEELFDRIIHYTAEEVESITSISAGQTRRVARLLAEHRPTSIAWCLDGTPHPGCGSMIHALRLLQLALGNVGKTGGGIHIFSGHDNIQGSTDMCVQADSLPAYSGLGEEAWRRWCRVWDVDFDWIARRFHTPDSMQKAGFSLSHLHRGAQPEEIALFHDSPIKVEIQWGCDSTPHRHRHKLKEAYDRLELLVVVDPFPAMAAAASDCENVYLLPGASQYETSGSVTSTSRQSQWRSRVVEPVHNSRDDYRILELLVTRLGFSDTFYNNIRQVPEDITRELAQGSLSIGYGGRTPERLKNQMENWHAFDVGSLRAGGGGCDGEFYGLPWPCWTNEHPGSPILDDISGPAAESGPPVGMSLGEIEAPHPSGCTENLPVAGGVRAPGTGSEVQGGDVEFGDLAAIEEEMT